MSFWGARSSGANRSRSGRSGGRGGTRMQEQVYAQDTAQLERRVLLLEQLGDNLIVVDKHFANIARGESETKLDRSASSMATALNLFRAGGKESVGDETAKLAVVAALKNFSQETREKYDRDGVSRESKEKIAGMLQAVRSHIMAVLDGQDVPRLRRHGLDRAVDHGDASSVNRAMEFVLAGSHETNDLCDNLRSDPDRYARLVAEKAQRGAQDGGRQESRAFDGDMMRLLQQDVARVTPIVSESAEEAQASLNARLARDRAYEEEMNRQAASMFDEDGDIQWT